MTESSGLIRGLEGVVAAETQLCDLDGVHGRLAYRGYDIADLARQATFEEVAYLLWHGALPRRAELDRLEADLVAARPIPDALTASTFTTRVIAATLSDMHSAVAGGVGALRGTLHGGAGEAVMRTLLEIGEVARVDAFVAGALAAKRRLMGFGHRVYKAGDPRA